jgi:hypothetical protein
MKRKIIAISIVCLTLFSCSNTANEYFEQAVLNCNLLYGFAGYELKRDLANPAEKLVDEKTMATAPIKRTELVQQKLETVESNFKKVKSLSITDDTKELMNASTALYEYVLPVYKNEYKQLAALYDSGAAADKIAAMEKSINEKYEPRFLELYKAVWVAGNAYAAKHGMQVKEVNPAPPKIANPS